MIKNKKMVSLLAAIGVILSMGTIVGSYWKLTGSSLNILTMGTFQNKIEEEYRVPKEVNPGDTIDKVVNVKNTGDVESLIRIRVEKVFGEKDSQGEFVKDETLDTDRIHIDYGKKWWIEKTDGYFYYKDVLKPGEITKEPLFQKYQLSATAGNAYKNKEGRIIVYMESIQADADIEEVWGITEKELGLTLKQGSDGKKTSVYYNGKNSGFQISQTTTDLFSSFKLLTPGCARTQVIEVENRSSESVEIFLHAEMPETAGVSEKQKELIENLMQKYAVIEVTENGKSIYHGPVSGKENGKGNNMQQDISLGKFPGNEKKNLVVKLSLDPEMDTDYSSLTGKVKWIFTAKGEDGSTVTTTAGGPKTGDNTNVFVWVFAVLASLGLAVAIFRRKGAEM